MRIVKCFTIAFSFILGFSVQAIAQKNISDPLQLLVSDVSDMYTSTDIDYNTRINRAAQKMKQLIAYVEANGDEGDTQRCLEAYTSFVKLLKRANRIKDLDKWNRAMMLAIKEDDPVRINYILYMTSAYKEDNDAIVGQSVAAMDYHGDGSQGLKFLSDFWPDSTSDYDKARLLAVKGDLELYSKQIDSAQKSFSEASELVDKARGKSAPESWLFRMFVEVAKAYAKDYQGALDIALELKREMMDFEQENALLGKQVRGSDYKEYPSMLSRMSTYYKLLGDATNELKCNQEALDAAYDVFGENLSILVPLQMESLPDDGPGQYLYRNLQDIKLSLANNLYDSGKKDEAKALYVEILKDYKGQVNNTSDYSQVDFKAIEEKMSPLIALASLCAYRYPGDAEIEQTSYDCALQFKSFSLLTEHLILDLVRRDNAPQTNQEYADIINLNKQLDNTKSVDEAARLQDEIRQKNENLLMNLDFSTVGTMMNHTWQDVARSLSADAAAIEFMAATADDGKLTYMANIVRKDAGPQLVTLCSQDQLQAILDPYGSAAFFNLIWKPLLPKLSGVKTVYFSPTGMLYKTGIEYLPNGDGQTFNQLYTVYRLSSTRMLADRPTVRHNGKAVVYGGVRYDVATGGSSKVSKSEQLDLDSEQKQSMRGGFKYLPNTLVEMRQISSILKSKEDNDTISGAAATESSFKALSGKDIDVLHVATHGFYVPKRRKSLLSKVTKNPFNSIEDQSLNRSGLLMAGAQTTLDHPNTTGEDGILTAKEIARMDLGQVDLVTLSACETGLGDVTGEGVFGLQRGFKKAGVKTILMSLWKVDDEATQILMSQFYKNLMSGKTKVEALREAQQFVRNTDNNKFAEPRYWAAFVLLDAL